MTEFNYHFNLQLPSNPIHFILDERTCRHHHTKTFNCKSSSESEFTKGSKALLLYAISLWTTLPLYAMPLNGIGSSLFQVK
jgi:hypothetical protein